MKNLTLRKPILSLFVLLFVCSISAFAQPDFDDEVADTPLDSKIYILAIASICFGACASYPNKSKNPA